MAGGVEPALEATGSHGEPSTQATAPPPSSPPLPRLCPLRVSGTPETQLPFSYCFLD